ncbi:MAG: threonylcarbamoyl-AMP synthase [Pelagibacteraceae bacterium TMED216]|nr:MAG: threonylcarbamoyl-AMP synthase [Pelagibacteraceae bacterium TMED216]|tara:strand:- start:113 stop:1066 length:954 start_codon:yes stop_codon:yes gene_type:complete
MKNIYANILGFDKRCLLKTVRLLNNSGIVALPTETVYGLAGNAYSDKAVRKIYKLKRRPKINPLIIHYHNIEDAKKDVQIDTNFLRLYKKFSPGPLTYVLKKKKKNRLSNLATSNLKTVAIRFPNNSIIRSILKKIKYPLAIPSANKSSYTSPVRPQDVFDDFKKKIKIIIDGGKCKIGLESTVLDLTNKFKLLRPGYISTKDIEKVLKKRIKFNKNLKKINSPGLLKKHYSPGIPLKLNVKVAPKQHAFITFGKKYPVTKNSFNLSINSDLNEAAKNLYSTLRKIKKLNYKQIYVVKIPKINIGLAINDRLKRAAN